MKVLITGAGGFIGSHLTDILSGEDCEIRAFLRYNSRSSRGWLDESSDRKEIQVISGDLRDYDSVEAAVKGVDVVFHLAALIGIPYSYVSPLAYVKTNIEGTYNVLQAALKHGVKRVVHTSTSEIYGTAQYVPIDEKHPVHPQSPYAASKSAADQLALSYYYSFDLPVTVVRPFNTFGPRQSARAVIPTIITQMLSGKKELSLGNLNSTRDFNYVKDTAGGMSAAGKAENAVGRIMNIGSGREISIGEAVRIIAGTMGCDCACRLDGERLRPPKSEVERLLCDASLAGELLSWKPGYSFEDGIRETVEWFRSNKEKYRADVYNI